MKCITMITGGARSGKSRYALSLARKISAPRAFIATAESVDEEMRRRIDHHRQERASDFTAFEEPLNPGLILKKLPSDIHVAVLDCLTVWIGNLMHRHPNALGSFEEIDRFLPALDQPPCDLIIVTNEVGMGIVPHNDLARGFRDIAGSLNQHVAAKADRVIFMVSGYPIVVKETES
ncbi:MAG: bifunctional adenosylcobinamide kinase/adenosylcobinamide-phosphate guanylyltransferase [Sedimentisphaerales bacterium]|nr:bifunctional adenosylcobinamide kinase/adenosylcobinamide-phosphate guanylyltransferase [Sedimentisphaerales bacterium]